MEIINKNYTYAIIGASNNKEKYGFIIVKDLLEKGYKIKPINPKGGTILEQKTYKNINEAGFFDIAVFVIPSEKVIKELRELPLFVKAVWMQPGSESTKAILFCKENNIFCIHSQCIMIESANKN